MSALHVHVLGHVTYYISISNLGDIFSRSANELKTSKYHFFVHKKLYGLFLTHFWELQKFSK